MSIVTQDSLDCIWVHVCFYWCLFCTPQSLIQKESEKHFFKMLLLNQAVSLANPHLSKEKHGVSSFHLSTVTIFSPVRDQGKRCHERPSGIVSRLNATLWHEASDRSITPPCLCRPLKNRLWRKADISLTYLSSAAVVNELQLVQLCLSVGLRIIGSLTKRREAELGSWDITESVGKAIDGKVWKHLRRPSDWQLIPTWKSMRQYQHICMCWRKSVCFNGLSVCSSRLMSACSRMNIIQRDDSEPAVSAGMSVGDWHIVEFFNSAIGARLGLVFRRVIWWNGNKSAILSFTMKKPGEF